MMIMITTMTSVLFCVLHFGQRGVLEHTLP